MPRSPRASSPSNKRTPYRTLSRVLLATTLCGTYAAQSWAASDPPARVPYQNRRLLIEWTRELARQPLAPCCRGDRRLSRRCISSRGAQQDAQRQRPNCLLLPTTEAEGTALAHVFAAALRRAGLVPEQAVDRAKIAISQCALNELPMRKERRAATGEQQNAARAGSELAGGWFARVSWSDRDSGLVDPPDTLFMLAQDGHQMQLTEEQQPPLRVAQRFTAARGVASRRP